MDKKIDINRLIPRHTHQRLAFYDYLSEHCPLPLRVIQNHKAVWNYTKIVKNKNICPIFRAILSVFISSEDYLISYSPPDNYTLDCIQSIMQGDEALLNVVFECTSVIKKGEAIKIIEVLEKYDVGTKINFSKYEYFQVISDPKEIRNSYFIRILQNIQIDCNHIYKNEEIINLLKYDASLQGVLSFDFGLILKSDIEIKPNLIKSNRRIRFEHGFFLKTKKLELTDENKQFKPITNQEKLDINLCIDWWYQSLHYPFNKQELNYYDKHISWGNISKNKNINWDLATYKFFEEKLNLVDVIYNIKDLDVFKIAYEKLKKTEKSIHETEIERFRPEIRRIIYADLLFYMPSYISFNTEHKIGTYKEYYNHMVNFSFFICYNPPKKICVNQRDLMNIGPFERDLWTTINSLKEGKVSKYNYFALNYKLAWVYLDIDSNPNQNDIDAEKYYQFSEAKQQFKKWNTEDARGILFFGEYPNPVKCRRNEGTKMLIQQKNYEKYEYYLKNINWDLISFNSKIKYDYELLETFEPFWNWDLISINPEINYDLRILSDFEGKLNWHLLSGLEADFWTEEIIDVFAHKLVWGLPDDICLEEFNNHIYGNIYEYEKYRYCLSSNKSIPWTINLINKHKRRIDWFQLSRNESLPWDEEFVIMFKDELMICKDTLLSNHSFIEKVLMKHFSIKAIDDFLNNEAFPNPIKPTYIKYLNRRLTKSGFGDSDRMLKYYWEIAHELKSVLKFGKYKGRTLKEVIEMDLEYLLWVIENVCEFDLDPHSYDYLDNIIYKYDTAETLIRKYDKAKNNSYYTYTPRMYIYDDLILDERTYLVGRTYDE